MVKSQAIVIGEKVYMGGGSTEDVEDDCQIFQFDPSLDEWSRLPPHQVKYFAMAQFMVNLITVGGMIQEGSITSKVYRFKEQSQKWEEFLKPIPTGRIFHSVTTTQSTIVASGGVTDHSDDAKPVPCATVEVYNSETSQWYTADPLPVPCAGMTSVTIANTWYLLGGGGSADNNKPIPTVLYAPLTTLIQRAISPPCQSASPMSVWKTLPDTPLTLSAAASLSGSLLAVGGLNSANPSSSAVQALRHFLGRDNKSCTYPAVHVFFPLTNSWVRVTNGDLPEPCHACTAVHLSSNRVLVVGGHDNQHKGIKKIFLGSVTVGSITDSVLYL